MSCAFGSCCFIKESLLSLSVRQRLLYLLPLEQACVWVTFLVCLWWEEESSNWQLKFICVCKRKMLTEVLFVTLL